MADCMMWKGGHPRVNYMWCDKDFEQWGPPVGLPNLKHTPPYDAHIDGTYINGYFTLGMPIYPFTGDWGKWQGKALRATNVGVGDFVGLVMMPSNHYATHIRFDVSRPDVNLAGATVKLTARKINYDAATEEWTYDVITDVEDAVTAQGLTVNIPIDDQVSVMVPLGRVDAGYLQYLYCPPVIVTNAAGIRVRYNSAIIFGFEVVTMPTNTAITLDQARNDMHFSTKIEGFECPGGM